jgi:hypothetical protein
MIQRIVATFPLVLRGTNQMPRFDPFVMEYLLSLIAPRTMFSLLPYFSLKCQHYRDFSKISRMSWGGLASQITGVLFLILVILCRNPLSPAARLVACVYFLDREGGLILISKMVPSALRPLSSDNCALRFVVFAMLFALCSLRSYIS